MMDHSGTHTPIRAKLTTASYHVVSRNPSVARTIRSRPPIYYPPFLDHSFGTERNFPNSTFLSSFLSSLLPSFLPLFLNGPLKKKRATSRRQPVASLARTWDARCTRSWIRSTRNDRGEARRRTNGDEKRRGRARVSP